MGLIKKAIVIGLMYAVYSGCSCAYDKVNDYTQNNLQENIGGTVSQIGDYLKEFGKNLEDSSKEKKEKDKQEPSGLENQVKYETQTNGAINVD